MPGRDRAEPLEDLDFLAEEYMRARDEADDSKREVLREEFVRRALPMAYRLSRRFRGRGESPEDLEQVARLGLVKTVDRYEPSRGSFTAYAMITITGELRRHFRDHAWGLHVTRRVQDLALEISHATVLLTAVHARKPTVAEIAAHLGLRGEEVVEAQATLEAYSPASLNAPLRDGGGAEVGDLVGMSDQDLERVDDRTSVRRLLHCLPERERRMLLLRFYGNYSQAEIAAEFGVSQMHVSRLLSRALTWLREAMLSDAPPRWTAGNDTDYRLQVEITSGGDKVTATVRGEIDRDNAEYLRDELLTAIDESGRGRWLIVDLTGVPLLDAAGISALLAVREAARVRGIRVRAVGLQRYVARVAAISGLRDLLE